MKVLITGNQGYIGSVLSQILLSQNFKVRGYDIGYFEEC
jgi:nucleoside-diphosphate-sugar epimerase